MISDRPIWWNFSFIKHFKWRNNYKKYNDFPQPPRTTLSCLPRRVSLFSPVWEIWENFDLGANTRANLMRSRSWGYLPEPAHFPQHSPQNHTISRPSALIMHPKRHKIASDSHKPDRPRNRVPKWPDPRGFLLPTKDLRLRGVFAQGLGGRTLPEILSMRLKTKDGILNLCLDYWLSLSHMEPQWEFWPHHAQFFPFSFGKCSSNDTILHLGTPLAHLLVYSQRLPHFFRLKKAAVVNLYPPHRLNALLLNLQPNV